MPDNHLNFSIAALRRVRESDEPRDCTTCFQLRYLPERRRIGEYVPATYLVTYERLLGGTFDHGVCDEHIFEIRRQLTYERAEYLASISEESTG